MVAGNVKRSLVLAGRGMSGRTLRRLDFAVSYLNVGAWIARHGFWPRQTAPHRPALFHNLFSRYGDTPVLYLEFGVYKGYSMRLWSKGLIQRNSRLFGFDCFEGLPDDWHANAPAGRFNVNGRIPQIDDPRLTFVKGLFEDTLPGFHVPEHTRLIVNLDADLYSSTRYVLDWLRPHLRAGDVLYFDEFFDRHSELRAWNEFLDAYQPTVRLIEATRAFNEVAFEIVELGGLAA
jgi:O-methyltransferase